MIFIVDSGYIYIVEHIRLYLSIAANFGYKSVHLTFVTFMWVSFGSFTLYACYFDMHILYL